MILTRTNNEILVRLPAYVDISEIQNLLDFIKYKELTTKSKATQTDANLLAKKANKSMWQKVKQSRGLN